MKTPGAVRNFGQPPPFINELRHLTPTGDFSPKQIIRYFNNFSAFIRQAGSSLNICRKALSNASQNIRLSLVFRRLLSSHHERYQFYQVPQDRERGCEKADNYG